jgi:hypothetical protein
LQKEITQLVAKYDFMDYAAETWADHFRVALIPERHSSIGISLGLRDIDSHRYVSWELLYWRYRQRPTGFNNLHFASLRGLIVVF